VGWEGLAPARCENEHRAEDVGRFALAPVVADSEHRAAGAKATGYRFTYGLASWEAMCPRSVERFANFSVHPVQVQPKGLTPVCVRTWADRCDVLTNALVHPVKLHFDGRSPVW
jgi:hypothetical protein